MLIHGLWQVRDIEVGVTIISDRLELGVERLLGTVSDEVRQFRATTNPSEADFVSKMVEASDAILGILVVVVSDKAKPETVREAKMTRKGRRTLYTSQWSGQ